MPTYNRVITDFKCGDDFDSLHILTNIPPGQEIGRAWLTAVDPVTGLTIFEKIITTIAVPGQGSITNGVTYSISVTAPAAIDETEISVRPIPLPLAAGATLTFTNGVTATLIKDAERDATTISVRPIGAGVPALQVATVTAAHVLFEIIGANSVLLTPEVAIPYDQQVQLSSGKINTPEDVFPRSPPAHDRYELTLMTAPIITPSSAVIRGNAAAVFIADQPTTWTASAGSISYAGKFRPANVTGAYTVTATNAAGEATTIPVKVEGVFEAVAHVGTEGETRKKIEASQSGGAARQTRRRSRSRRHVKLQADQLSKSHTGTLRAFFDAHAGAARRFWWHNAVLAGESECFFDGNLSIQQQSFDWFDLRVSLREAQHQRPMLAMPGHTFPYKPDLDSQVERERLSISDDSFGGDARAARDLGASLEYFTVQFSSRSTAEFLLVEQYWDCYYSGKAFYYRLPTSGLLIAVEFDSNLRWTGQKGGLMDYSFALKQSFRLPT